MNIKSFLQIVVLIVLISLKLAPAQSQAPSDMIPPPKPGLVAVNLPDLEKLEPEVRQHILSFQSSLAALAKDAQVNAEKLSEAYGVMGQLYQAYSLMEATKECYLNARSLAPRDFRWAYLLASVHHKEGRAEEAINYYNQARALRSDYLPAMVNLGNLYLERNRIEEARAAFKEALAINSNCGVCLYGLGQAALSSRDYREAVEQLERAIREAPEANRIHYALAMAYRGLGEIEKAKAHLERQGPVGVRVADPIVDELQQMIRGERLHLIRGRMAFDARRYTEAVDEYRKAVAANPRSVPARVNLGSALAEMEKTNEAIEQFQEAIRLNQENAAAHYNLGVLLAKQGRHDEAILRLQSALKLNSDDSEARFILAGELMKTNRADEAIGELARVVELNPDNEEALLEQARLLFLKKQYKEAIASIEKSHRLYPQKGRTAALLAYLLAASPDESLRNGERALELARRVYAATGLINHGAIVAMALAELGRCSEAAELQKRLIAQAEQSKRNDLIEKLKSDLQRYEKAKPCRAAIESALKQENKKP